MTSKMREKQGTFAKEGWGGAWPAQSTNGINPSDLIMDFSNGKDRSLISNDSEVRLARQKLLHRRVLFWGSVVMCGLLYVLFFAMVIYACSSCTFFQILLTYKHIGAFILALLIVPSALLWGLLRAAYMPEHSPKESDSLIKAATNLHPAGDA